MKVRKKIFYYIAGVAAIFVLSVLGPLRVKEDGDISVLAGVMRLSKAVLQQSSVKDAFRACDTYWMYMLMPVVAAVPSASYIYEELRSRFYMGLMIRKGKKRYIYTAFLYSAVSGGVVVAAGLVLYAIILCCIFPLNSINSMLWDYEKISAAQLLVYLLGEILYRAMYGMAMSLLGTFLVYLYPNLYVDLSILFIISYIFRETAMMGNFAFPLFLAAVMVILYGAIWKWRFRGERI